MVAPAPPQPPCPTCSWPLRWFPEQRQWGCDRCRVMLPPAVSAPKRGGIALVLGLVMLIGGIAWASNAPSEHSDGGGDAGAYEAANKHAEAVYGGGLLAAAGGVLVLIGFVRRAGPQRPQS